MTKVRIAAAHGRLSCIRQVAPVCTPPNTSFLGFTRVHQPNGITIGAAIFAQLTAEYRRARPGMYFTLKIVPSHGATWNPFAQLTAESRYTLQLAAPFPLKIAHCHGGSEPPSNTWFLGSTPTRVLNSNGISIGSGVFVSYRPTDHATRSVIIGRIYV